MPAPRGPHGARAFETLRLTEQMMVEGLPRATPRAAGATLAFSVARPSAALMARLMRGEVHVWRARA
ncbi:4'-phosphopantetheinyl transferase family domain protein [Burkholderia pseudomallei MSHR5596]|nr:4'-phosphopantetheinyl transferase family domain protein [Burkholderia pseudomallei MSHR5596]